MHDFIQLYIMLPGRKVYTMNNGNSTMKNLPMSEQPYVLCENRGAEALTDAQLIAVIIKNGTREEKSTDVAVNLLRQSVTGNLSGLCTLSIKQMMKVKGIGKVKALQLVCAIELAKRIEAEKIKPDEAYESPRDLAGLFMQRMRFLRTEEARCAYFDAAGHLLGEVRLSSGDLCQAPIPMREIFMKAIEMNAYGLVLAHNHPGGTSDPSEQDDGLTRKLAGASKIIGVVFIDHIIIGDNKYYSFRENGKIV